MPENETAGAGQEPAWPSADRDESAGEQEQSTNELPVPKVTREEAQTVWVRRPEPTPEEPARAPEWPTHAHGEQTHAHGEQTHARGEQTRARGEQTRGAGWPAQPPEQAGPPAEQRTQPVRPPRQVPEIRQAGVPARPMRIEPSGEIRPAPATTGEQRQPQPGRQHPPQPPQQAAPQQQPQQSQQPQRPQQQAPPPRPQQPPPPPPVEQAEQQAEQQEAEQAAPEQAQEPGQQAPPRRKRRGLLVGGVAAVLVVAVGVALALPYVSNRLGLPWAPNAPRAAAPEPVAVSRSLHGPRPEAPAPTPEGVAAALRGPAGSPALGDFTGRVLDPATGTVLWESSPDEVRVPASTTKLLTAAAALLAVDHGKQLTTKVVAGQEPGTVVLVAGGDVTLTGLPEGQDPIYRGAARLDDLVAQVKQAGIPVERVRLDLSAFTGPEEAQGWAPNDAPSTFMSAVQPVMLDGGRGEPTGMKSMRVADPAGRLAERLAGKLGASVGEPTTAPQGAQVLGEVRSAPLTELVDQMLTLSDNLLAEVIARQVAVETGKEPSFSGGAEATIDVLAENGFDVEGLELSDGSGLSVRNRVSSTLLSELLAVAAAPDGSDPRTAKLRPMLGGLPVAGASGTLAGRYDGSAAEGKGWVRAKTGTLSEVNTLAGVVLDADGRVLVFALMSGGSALEPAQAALDEVAATLRECGCR
ncbi:D-alanyl-D-alanine carboxypeptidase/D-alanyl-D-alanine endopeptidase [Amycolatopsis aidingensis]|uniref:D-alanyl-D-alanine carboxypeptidase/D-alanyl-D-alanine endopeptidase n=1 Tax=Amycolatopsis aidingensis TaxID=2842453 RepID=UPI001E558195|nr:D-alanyl-D-alanine carboxypeptidase/D-alanyl-D-alanine-endopeptidase [Amycolatopsis aidingensis]